MGDNPLFPRTIDTLDPKERYAFLLPFYLWQIELLRERFSGNEKNHVQIRVDTESMEKGLVGHTLTLCSNEKKYLILLSIHQDGLYVTTLRGSTKVDFTEGNILKSKKLIKEVFNNLDEKFSVVLKWSLELEQQKLDLKEKEEKFSQSLLEFDKPFNLL